MQTYATSTTVQGQGEVHVAGVPFAAGTEVEVMISPRRKNAAEFAQAWERVCSQIRATPGVDEISEADIQTEIDRYRAGS
jgi:hypothetical protein